MQSTPARRYQQLQSEDRVTLASLVQQKYSVHTMAQVLGAISEHHHSIDTPRRTDLRPRQHLGTYLCTTAALAGPSTDQRPL